MIKVSAPGKVHLMGEHAVVYGKPALLAAIDRRISVTVEQGTKGVTVSPESLASDARAYIDHILALIQKEFAIDSFPSMNIMVNSEIPFGYHLGSSAALAVATIGAVSYFAKKVWNPIAINKLAFEAEKYVHGNPSGGDNTIVTMGGFVWFRKELPFLKSIWQLPMKLSPSLDHFMLINTGKPEETTGEMVEFVAERRREGEKEMEKLFSENEVQTRRVAIALKDGDQDALMDAVKRGEQTLESMGVVSRKSSSIIRIIELHGGAAKILGGGGKKGAVGFLLCYYPDKTVIDEACTSLGYSVEAVTLGEEGVRLENKGE